MSGFGLVLANYVRRGLTYRWTVLIPTVFVFALVTLYGLTQPDTYESTAVLMSPIAQPVDGTTRSTAGEMARNMFRSAAERMLSTNTLTQVAEKLQPFPLVREQRGILAEVEMLRKQIRVEMNSGTGSISVTATCNHGENPAEMAANIANLVTDLFIRSQQDAIEDEANKHKMRAESEKRSALEKLETAQSALDQFKQQYAGSLPDDVEGNNEQIDRLTQQMVDSNQNVRSLQFEIARIHRDQIRLDAEAALVDEDVTADFSHAMRDAEAALTELRLQLKLLQVDFDHNHERVVRLQALIAGREQIIEDLKNTSNQRTSAQKRKDLLKYLIDEGTQMLAQYEKDIRAQEAAVLEIEKRREEVRTRIITAAKIDMQYTSLKRSVENAERFWEDSERAYKASELMERSVRGGINPIQIEQRAFIAARPAGPDRLITSLLGLGLGLGLGVGLAIAHYKLDASYHRAEDLRALLPGAVLVTIPEVAAGGAKVGRAILAILGGLILFALFLATVAVLGTQVGWWGEPEMIHGILNLR